MSRTAEIAPHDRRDRHPRCRSASTATGAGARATGVGFLDHMLDLLARHGRLDLDVARRRGDLETGAHHTVEDVGIVLRPGARPRRSATAPGSPATATRSCRWTRRARCCAIDISGPPVPARSTRRAAAGRDRRLRARAARGVLPRGRQQRAADAAPRRSRRGTNAHHMIEARVQGVRARAARRGRDRPDRDRRAVDEGDADR